MRRLQGGLELLRILLYFMINIGSVLFRGDSILVAIDLPYDPAQVTPIPFDAIYPTQAHERSARGKAFAVRKTRPSRLEAHRIPVAPVADDVAPVLVRGEPERGRDGSPDGSRCCPNPCLY